VHPKTLATAYLQSNRLPKPQAKVPSNEQRQLPPYNATRTSREPRRSFF